MLTDTDTSLIDSGGSGRAETATLPWRAAVFAIAALALLAWSLVYLRHAHILRGGIVYLAVTTYVFVGAGALGLRLARVRDAGLSWAGLRYIVGFSLAAFIITLMGAVGLGGPALWVALVVASAGWVLALRDWVTRPESRPALDLIAAELFAGALLLRICLQGSEVWKTIGSRVHYLPYWDMLYHLALAKDAINRGLPLSGSPLETGIARAAYHPAFDSLTSVFIKTLHLPVDVAFFRLVLPFTLLALFVAIAVFATAWGRSRLAGVLALGMIALTVGLNRFGSHFGGLAGFGDLLPLRYFAYNPPGAVGSVGALAALSVAALALAGTVTRAAAPAGMATVVPAAGPPAPDSFAEERWASYGPLVLGGILAGATALMKAPIAVVVAPAFMLAIAAHAWRRGRRARLAALAGLAATTVAGGLAYLTTLGKGGAFTISWGALADHLMHSSPVALYPKPLRDLISPLAGHGAGTDIVYILAYYFFALAGLWLIVTCLAAWRARARGERPFHASPLASHAALAAAALAGLVGLGLAQRGAGSTSSWNISLHTIQVLWWLGIGAAAVALAAALPRLPWRRVVAARALGVFLVAILAAFAYTGARPLRQVDWGYVPVPLFTILNRLDTRTPVDAVVVQNFDVERFNWVSAIGGRRAVLERATTGRDLFPARTAFLKGQVDLLYATADAAAARQAAREMGADYAILKLGKANAQGLRAISTVVMRSGGWELLKLPAR